MSGCVVESCTVEGVHEDGCLTRYTSRMWVAEHERPVAGGPSCRGCTPQPVEMGRLCWWHVKRLRGWLATAGEQHAALLEDLAPGCSGGAEPVSGSRSVTRVPLAITPLATAQDLARILSGLVEVVAHEHPEDQAPARMLTMWDRQTDDPVQAKIDPDTGKRYATEPDPVWHPKTAAAWLSARLARVADLDGIEFEMLSLGEVMGAAHRLAPIEAHMPQRLACIPCPWCHAVHLTRYPAEMQVECGSCHGRMLDDSYQAWTKEVQRGVA